MLRRLPSYLLSDVHELIRHLGGGTFYKGDLTARLAAVDLSRLAPDKAQALGVAVGRRTIRETFNVKIEGVDTVIANPERYPAPYRAGLVRGLLLNEQGTLCTWPWASASRGQPTLGRRPTGSAPWRDRATHRIVGLARSTRLATSNLQTSCQDGKSGYKPLANRRKGAVGASLEAPTVGETPDSPTLACMHLSHRSSPGESDERLEGVHTP